MIVEGAWLGTTIISLVGLGVIGCCCPDQQQQQQITVTDDKDEPRRICPDCGLVNPKEAEYCGDCGFRFKQTRENNNE